MIYGEITDDGLSNLSSLNLNKLLVSLYYGFGGDIRKRNTNITVEKLLKLQSVKPNWTIEVIED